MSNIVVMEDDEVQAEMLAESLNLMGHEVTRRRNAEEALEAVLAEPPDLLITDIFVKQDDRIGSNGGVLLIGRVRNAGRKEGTERLADLPILAISGGFVHSGGLSIEEISRSIGATTFLAKPFS
ncbi:MAG: response regulator, partial [Pseudomonadota bacterium]